MAATVSSSTASMTDRPVAAAASAARPRVGHRCRSRRVAISRWNWRPGRRIRQFHGRWWRWGVATASSSPAVARPSPMPARSLAGREERREADSACLLTRRPAGWCGHRRRQSLDHQYRHDHGRACRRRRDARQRHHLHRRHQFADADGQRRPHRQYRHQCRHADLQSDEHRHALERDHRRRRSHPERTGHARAHGGQHLYWAARWSAPACCNLETARALRRSRAW